jgi:hypothetical protein
MRCFLWKNGLMGGLCFGSGWLGEICGYILTVRGSVSLKLSADSAGRTISFSPV